MLSCYKLFRKELRAMEKEIKKFFEEYQNYIEKCREEGTYPVSILRYSLGDFEK